MKTLASFALLATFPLASAEPPVIGSIEIYGARRVSHDKILKALGAKAGGPLPASKGAAEERIEAVSGVVQARLEAFCCEAGQPILYVGVLERGALSFEYRDSPTEEITLPEEIPVAYHDFGAALSRAISEGDTEEDLSQGHSLMKNLACRVLQERFAGFAQISEPKLKQVLQSAADPEQRAIAAYVLGYAPDKKTVASVLQQALRDPDAEVRANALRALRAIAVLARNKELGIIIRPTWFVEMLNSLSLSDRLEGARTILLMFDELSEGTREQIRERALDSLFETARWQYLPHALPAYLLLGRVAGLPEDEVQNAWSQGERDKELDTIRKALKRK
jgi:hypothetical protein